jgi:uncharacterized membrane protein
MDIRAKFLGHPIHQMLIVFPLGLLATAVVCDLIYLFADRPTAATVSYWMIGAGIIGGLLAAPFGWIDWFAIPRGTRARAIGLWHGVGNVVVLLLFAGSWYLRHRGVPEQPETITFVLSFLGAGLALVTGWLGGELIDRLGVGVHEGANVNAPSSLSHRSPHERAASRA